MYLYFFLHFKLQNSIKNCKSYVVCRASLCVYFLPPLIKVLLNQGKWLDLRSKKLKIWSRISQKLVWLVNNKSKLSFFISWLEKILLVHSPVRQNNPAREGWCMFVTKYMIGWWKVVLRKRKKNKNKSRTWKKKKNCGGLFGLSCVYIFIKL